MSTLGYSCGRFLQQSLAIRQRAILSPLVAARCISRTNITLKQRSDEADPFRPSEDLLKERYEMRQNEDLDTKRARLLYQSRKRGMLENGVILASFADKYLNKLDSQELDLYDRLINLPTNDWDIYYWATKTKPTPAEFETSVMVKLREHLKSKVSRQSINSNSHQTNSNLFQHNSEGKGTTTNDNKSIDKNRIAKRLRIAFNMEINNGVILPASKPTFGLNPDYSDVSLTDYQRQLFDSRFNKIDSRTYIQRMTDWRKKYFTRRLRRTIPAPVSIRHMSEENAIKTYYQKSDGPKPVRRQVVSTKPLDTVEEKTAKQHNFLQFLMSNKFTESVAEYEAEAKAWAEMIWHRDYGSADPSIMFSQQNCKSCNAQIQCCDTGLEGYIPKELFRTLCHKLDDSAGIECQRCKFHNTYNVDLDLVAPSEQAWHKLLAGLKDRPPSLVCLVVDLTDLPCGIIKNLPEIVGLKHNIIVVGNKLDLLPHDGDGLIERVVNVLKNNLSDLRPGSNDLRVADVVVLSARTGFNVDSLITKLYTLSQESPKDVYLVGHNHAGKSTLFNALLQSDLSAIRNGDLVSRVSPFEWSGITCEGSPGPSTLRFPINIAEEWEVALKRRRLERVERDVKRHEKSLLGTTRARQATKPHMSMLIDRTADYPSLAGANELEMYTERAKFAPDHPLKSVETRKPLSASRDEFRRHMFCHITPGAESKNQLNDLLRPEERLQVHPLETIVPRKFSLRPLESIFLAGLARLDLLTATSNVILTVFASKHLPVYVIATRKADKFYRTFLGTPYLAVPSSRLAHTETGSAGGNGLREWPALVAGEEDFHIRSSQRYDQGSADIVLSSAGWVLVNVRADQECIVRAHTPQARGIFKREPPLLAGGLHLKGRKIRDTPLFANTEYNIGIMDA